MTDSLRILLAECIDYAGLFPPAQLSLKKAVGNFAAYQQDRDCWMLARFVCPAQQLGMLGTDVHKFVTLPPLPSDSKTVSVIRRMMAKQLGVDEEKITPESMWLRDLGADSLDTVELVMELEEEFNINVPDNVAEKIQTVGEFVSWLEGGRSGCRVAVTGTAVVTSKMFIETLRRDIRQIVRFQSEHGHTVTVDTLELKLPRDAFNSPDSRTVSELIDAVRLKIYAAELTPITIFFELPADGNGQSHVTSALESIEDRQGTSRLGLKVRTGSPDGSLTPSPEQLAFFIESCRAAGVVWKATAGLHHPLRHYDETSQAWQFGFLNVLAAAVLAWTHNLCREEILPILTETSIGRFTFDQELISWGDYRATLDEIERARQETMISFGSCSFDEPREGLRELLLIA